MLAPLCLGLTPRMPGSIRNHDQSAVKLRRMADAAKEGSHDAGSKFKVVSAAVPKTQQEWILTNAVTFVLVHYLLWGPVAGVLLGAVAYFGGAIGRAFAVALLLAYLTTFCDRRERKLTSNWDAFRMAHFWRYASGYGEMTLVRTRVLDPAKQCETGGGGRLPRRLVGAARGRTVQTSWAGIRTASSFSLASRCMADSLSVRAEHWSYAAHAIQLPPPHCRALPWPRLPHARRDPRLLPSREPRNHALARGRRRVALCGEPSSGRRCVRGLAGGVRLCTARRRGRSRRRVAAGGEWAVSSEVSAAQAAPPFPSIAHWRRQEHHRVPRRFEGGEA